MRIISPVDNFAESAALMQAGANELYGGYLPDDWESYGLAASLNQRTFTGAQISSEQELADIISLAHDQGGSFSLTLNAPYYIENQTAFLIDYVARMVNLGIDGLILADPGILRVLKKQHPRLEMHASTLAHLSNAGAVKFMQSQGVQRVVLPRHLNVADMGSIVEQVPDIKFDAFFLVGKCPNTEGLCTFHHSSPDKIWPCEIPYEVQPLHGSGSNALVSAMQRQKGWAETNRRHGCGLCAVPHLKTAGVSGLKLVGRGAPAAQKVRNVTLTREFVMLAEECTNFSAYRSQAMSAHKERFGAACHQNVCYYPEYFYGGEA